MGIQSTGTFSVKNGILIKGNARINVNPVGGGGGSAGKGRGFDA